MFVLNRAAVTWSSKKQKTVALSSCEAEIVAASEAAREAVHLTRFATELGLHDGSAIDLHVDNKSAIDVAYNPEHHSTMKHVDRRNFYVRELVEDHKIRVPFVSTVNNIADFFTKALPPKTFVAMRDVIMNVPLDQRADAPTSGSVQSPRVRLDATAVASGAVRTKRRHARSSVPALGVASTGGR